MTEYILGVNENVVADLIQGGSYPTVKGTVRVADAPYGVFFTTTLEGRKFLLAIPPGVEATKVNSSTEETEWIMAVERDETSNTILRIMAIERSSGSQEFASVISQLQNQ